MEEIVIIIPAYKPNQKIMSEFILKLQKEFKNILIINDGSGEEYREFFEKWSKMGIPVLNHYVNLGKGRAIKTAFNYILNCFPNVGGGVTADCDGQHSISDIKKCAKALEKNPDELIIGTRNFDLEQVPFKSRYGNKITRFIFSLFIGLKITDTQSGLRGFSKKLMQQFLPVNGERYEYETNMLISCKEENIKIEEIAIKTIYINQNETSHFHPLRDSVLIYKLFLKYIVSALSSFILDIGLFTLFLKLLPEIKYKIFTNILLATIIARLFSSYYNYKINEKLVFKNKSKSSIHKYFVLVVLQMFISGFLVSSLFSLFSISAPLLKIMVDVGLFIANFFIQREWVFKQKKKY